MCRVNIVVSTKAVQYIDIIISDGRKLVDESIERCLAVGHRTYGMHGVAEKSQVLPKWRRVHVVNDGVGVLRNQQNTESNRTHDKAMISTRIPLLDRWVGFHVPLQCMWCRFFFPDILAYGSQMVNHKLNVVGFYPQYSMLVGPHTPARHSRHRNDIQNVPDL